MSIKVDNCKNTADLDELMEEVVDLSTDLGSGLLDLQMEILIGLQMLADAGELASHTTPDALDGLSDAHREERRQMGDYCDECQPTCDAFTQLIEAAVTFRCKSEKLLKRVEGKSALKSKGRHGLYGRA